MPKKILIFSLAYYPKHVGGAEVAIKEITDRIPKEEIEFHMVALRFDDTLPEVEQIGNVLVHRIGLTRHNPTMADLGKFPLYLNKFIFQFSAPKKAGELHKKYQYDAVWAMMAHSTGVPAGIFKTLHPKVQYLLTLQEGDPIPYIKKKMLPVYPLFVRGFTKADMVQAISTYLSRWARDMGFKGKMEIIPNAVNIKHFSQEFSNEEIETVKTKLGKKDGDIFMITTSRLVKKNACDDVIKSLVLLPENIKFAILGIGPDEEMLRALAKEKGVSERVIFLGQVDHAEMPKYLKACDIFIRPSLSEGMGNSFVEAFTAGLPVIATQEGGISDFLFDPEINSDQPPTGRAVKPRDPEGIARTVKLFLENKEKTTEITSNAKKLALEKYDWDKIAKDMKEKVFTQLFQ
ncbi:MAG: glycosyltransferase family 4 protein [Candidatus Parcubacteria bacterium]|nr:glycosyltransferase family 4 protein [Candidatus Parcubacteria bacterium]